MLEARNRGALKGSVLWNKCLCPPPYNSYIEILTHQFWYLEIEPLIRDRSCHEDRGPRDRF